MNDTMKQLAHEALDELLKNLGDESLFDISVRSYHYEESSDPIDETYVEYRAEIEAAGIEEITKRTTRFINGEKLQDDLEEM
jgi:hypothetical protein